jgi:arylsulfatase A-like enzyme
MTGTPNVVWITLESVRADHTTLGGYDRETTPNLRRIVEEGGSWFSQCFSHDRWTPAVSASILHGTTVSTHGVGLADTTKVNTVRDDLRTLPELFGERGYRTACFSSNPYVGPPTGLDRGFDRFHYVPTKTDLLSTSGVACAARYARNVRRHGAGLTTAITRHKDCIYPLYQTEVLRKWLRELAAETEPFFVYTHFNSSHHPYNPPLSFLREFTDDLDVDLSPEEAIELARGITNNIWREVAKGCSFDPRQRAALRAVYDAEIAYVDELVGQLFDRVRAVAPDETIVVVTGDHGELFGERGMLGHNLVLHDGLIHVPLVTWGLDGVENRTDDLVQHTDVSRTVAATAGCESDQFEGYDLRSDRREYALVQRGPRPSDLERIREFDPSFDTSRYHSGMVDCVRSHDWKYVESDDGTELFRLPDETTDVADRHPGVVAQHEAALERLLPDEDVDHDATEQAGFTTETEQRLADLGYL